MTHASYFHWFPLAFSWGEGHPHPDLQLDPLVVAIHRLHLEVDAYGANKGVAEGIVSIAEQEGRFPDAAVSDDEQLEHVVKVLVRAVPLAKTLVCLRHLDVGFTERKTTQSVTWRSEQGSVRKSLIYFPTHSHSMSSNQWWGTDNIISTPPGFTFTTINVIAELKLLYPGCCLSDHLIGGLISLILNYYN